jgi:hypothetical protein
MRSGRSREFWCSVVSEPVLIRLTRLNRLMRPGDYFVQCNQADCQYVEANAPPCPLHVGMFAEEIRAAAVVREARHERY